MKKTHNINQLRAGAVLSYINMAIGSLIPMFYTPVMLSILGQYEYGLYKLSSSVTSYLSLISFGIGSAVVRYLIKYRTAGDKEGEQKMFGLFNMIFSILSAIVLIVGIIISFNLPVFYGNSLTIPGQLDKMKILVFVLSLHTVLNFLCFSYNAVVTSHERFLFLQSINIIVTVITPLANILVLLMGFKSIGMVISSLVLTLVVRVCYILYVRYSIKIKPIYKKMPKHLIKEILFFSLWVFVANVVNQLYNSTDTLIIGYVPALATVGVAVYNIGVTFSGMLQNFSTGIISVLTPKVNGMVFSNRSNSELTDLMIRIGRLQCYIIALVCTGFIAFGKQFIKLWAGEGYEEAYWVAILTMIPACIPLIQNIALNVIVAQNKHKFRSLTYLFIAIVNVLGTALCVNRFGIIGAALVTGIATVIGQGIIMNWYYWKRIKLEIPRFWGNVSRLYIFPIILCAISLCISSFVNFENTYILFIGIILYTIIFTLFNWLFVMNDYEKDIFRGPIGKIKNKLKR